MKKLKYILFGLPVLLFTKVVSAQAPAPGPAPAPAPGPVTPTGLQNPLRGGVNNIPDLLNLILRELVIPIGGVVVVFMIIYTGFLFVMARGNPAGIEKAKKSLVHTVIGAAIILGAFAITVIIKTILGDITNAI